MRFAKNTQHDTSEVLRLPRKMTMDTSKVLHLPRKLQLILRRRRKSIPPATQNHFRHVTKHVWMSRSATPAMRNEATRLLKPPKRTPSAELTIVTAIGPSRERLRTVADGCERKRNVERTHPQPPDPQSETGTLATHSGKKCISFNKKTGDEPRDLGCIYSIFRHTILESSLNSLIFIACGSIEALATGNHLFVHWRRLLPIEIAPWELNRWHVRPASLGDKRLVVDHRLLHWVTPVVALNWLTWMCIPGPYMFVNQLSIYIYIYACMYPFKPAIYPFNLSIFSSFMSFVNQFIHQLYAHSMGG